MEGLLFQLSGFGTAGLNPINATERKNSAEHLAPGTLFAKPHNSKNGCDHGKEISENAQLLGFQVAQQPEIKDVRDRGTEDRHVQHRGPASPGVGSPVSCLT